MKISNNHSNKAGVLMLPENAKISYLPKGLRKFMDQYPQQFNNYLSEIKAVNI